MQFSQIDKDAAIKSQTDNKKNYYQLLDVQVTATLADIKKAYRKLVLIYHPDKTDNDAAKAAYFTQINQAFEILSDNERRYGYYSGRKI